MCPCWSSRAHRARVSPATPDRPRSTARGRPAVRRSSRDRWRRSRTALSERARGRVCRTRSDTPAAHDPRRRSSPRDRRRRRASARRRGAADPRARRRAARHGARDPIRRHKRARVPRRPPGRLQFVDAPEPSDDGVPRALAEPDHGVPGAPPRRPADAGRVARAARTPDRGVAQALAVEVQAATGSALKSLAANASNARRNLTEPCSTGFMPRGRCWADPIHAAGASRQREAILSERTYSAPERRCPSSCRPRREVEHRGAARRAPRDRRRLQSLYQCGRGRLADVAAALPRAICHRARESARGLESSAADRLPLRAGKTDRQPAVANVDWFLKR
jgi:hypothetical protein